MSDPKYDDKLTGNILYRHDANGKTAYEVALEVGNKEFADEMAKLMGSPLFIACIRNDIPEMKRLIESGVGVDIQNKCGETVMHYAAAYGNL